MQRSPMTDRRIHELRFARPRRHRVALLLEWLWLLSLLVQPLFTLAGPAAAPPPARAGNRSCALPSSPSFPPSDSHAHAHVRRGPHPTPTVRTRTPRNVFLVIFRSYAQHAEHERTLITLLSQHAPSLSLNSSTFAPQPWRVVPRHNRASAFPTDFLVVHCATLRDEALLSLPSSHSSVIKYVTREQRYRHLLSVARPPPPPPPDGSRASSSSVGDPYTEFDIDPLNVGSFALPRRFSSAAALSQSLPAFAARYSELRHNATPSSASSLPTRQLYARRLLSAPEQSVSRRYLSSVLWEKGFSGAGIRVAVFDTGLSARHPHFKRIRERSNWTDNDTLDDEIGHGTHVAGVIAGHFSDCLGFAPDAELFVFRVFNTRQLSFTSWFLDAFNYAIQSRVHVLNLSIGGPDFHDRPFVDKVQEMSANGITVVSAIGNDGPLYGTLNNPADQMDVIGVGGLNADDSVAHFSSRGMTTWELPHGYGRVKPDVVAFANGVMGSKIPSGCKAQTGTSVASPVVAGAVVLLASSIPEERRAAELNPARLKQALTVGARRVKAANVFEQGAGKLDLLAAFDHLSEQRPHVSAIPASLDLTDCPYMWPYCTQELYHTGMPTLLNVTLLNSISVASTIVDPPTFTASVSSLVPSSSSLLSLSFLYSQPLWPWSGFLAIELTVQSDVAARTVVEGTIAFTVESDDGSLSSVSIPLRVAVIPRPPRALRVLWDQYHNLRYPSGYFPRDNLEVKTDTLDWNGDHPHTNYRDLYHHLRARGYFLEVLGRPLLCFDASLYGALLLVDSEEEWWSGEREKLYADVTERGLSVLVVGEWYNVEVMREVKFWDENTASWWTPETGGANVPALNDLLAPFAIAFSHHIVKGRVNVTDAFVPFSSGTTIARFPAGGRLLYGRLQDAGSGAATRDYAVMGLWQPRDGSGRVVVWGDSNCMDLNSNHAGFCTHLFDELMAFASPHSPPPAAFSAHPSALLAASELQTVAYVDPTVPELPVRMVGNNLAKYSKVISPHASPSCVSPFDVRVARPADRSSGTGAAFGLRRGEFLRRKTGQLTAGNGTRVGSWWMAGQGDFAGKGFGLSQPSSKQRHQFRTALTSVALLLVLLFGVLLPSLLLLLFHLYGADDGKRSAEELGGAARQGRSNGGWGHTLWLWFARKAPSFCVALLRLAHSFIMAQQATPSPSTLSSPIGLARGSSVGLSRQESGPVIVAQ